mmetsp:Transcript_11920/g.32091  ORF Transcript_11920/g.32091 Transcript_11920/m.32091 type:complete len:247 (+) Transcript_11920:725-1465(+)
MPTMTRECLHRPTMAGNTARGASSPAKPALMYLEPRSITTAHTSLSSASSSSGATRRFCKGTACDLFCDRRVDGDVLQGLLPSRLASGAVLVEHGPRHRLEARLPTCSELAAGAVLCLDLLVSGFRCSGAFLVDLLLLPCSGTAHRIVARAHALVEPRLEAGRRAHRACTSGRDTLVLQGACELEKSADELRGACAGLLGLLRPGLSLLLGTIGDAIVHLVLVDVLGLLDGADEEHIAAELHRCKG